MMHTPESKAQIVASRALFKKLRAEGKLDELSELKKKNAQRRKNKDSEKYQKMVAAAAKARAARMSYIAQGIPNGKVHYDDKLEKLPRLKPGQSLTFKPPAAIVDRGELPLGTARNGHKHRIPQSNAIVPAKPRIVDAQAKEVQSVGVDDLEGLAEFVVLVWRKLRA